MAVSKYMNRIIAAREMDLGDDEERLRSSVMAVIHVGALARDCSVRLCERRS